jgi:hypothetical protein
MSAPGVKERGTIPACARPTSGMPRRSARATDHPRVRGADAAVLWQAHAGKGPPPRARGRHLLSWDFNEASR